MWFWSWLFLGSNGNNNLIIHYEKNAFYDKFLEFLEIESVTSLNEKTSITDLEEYDSFFVLTIVAFVDDNFSIDLSAKQLNGIETIGDLMTLIGNENFID